ncbi:hypothetical protein GCM10009792_08580 [Microcella alkalica]
MIAATDRREHSGFDSRPVVHDLRVAEPENAIPATRELGIAASIVLESARRVVELSPIDFHDERRPDQEVDPANAGDEHLALQLRRSTRHAQPEERFCS